MGYVFAIWIAPPADQVSSRFHFHMQSLNRRRGQRRLYIHGSNYNNEVAESEGRDQNLWLGTDEDADSDCFLFLTFAHLLPLSHGSDNQLISQPCCRVHP